MGEAGGLVSIRSCCISRYSFLACQSSVILQDSVHGPRKMIAPKTRLAKNQGLRTLAPESYRESQRGKHSAHLRAMPAIRNTTASPAHFVFRLCAISGPSNQNPKFDPTYRMQSPLRSPQGILACVPSRYSVPVENVRTLAEHRYRNQLSQPPYGDPFLTRPPGKTSSQPGPILMHSLSSRCPRLVKLLLW
jgi:hypothetical protein